MSKPAEDTDDGEEITVEELDQRAEEALSGEKFISFEEHIQRRDD